MKVVLYGSTGFIGSAILSRCLQTPSITSVLALTRRALPASPDTEDPKLKNIIVEDFLHYPDSLLEELAGAEISPEIDIDYPLAAANAFATHVAPSLSRKFRFLMTSGGIASRDQDAKLWFMQELRRSKGEAENRFVEFGHQHADVFEALVARPGFVLTKERTVAGMVPRVILVDQLAAAMVDVAEKGSELQSMENDVLKERGKRALRERN